MEYTTIYEIADTGLSANWWWILALAAGLILALIVIPRFRQKYGFAAFAGLFLVAIIFQGTHPSKGRIFSEIAAGRLHTEEGIITHFKPAVWGRGEAAIERFTIGESEFAYSSQSRGFNQIQVNGGPLKDNLNVRLSYVNLDSTKEITKVELRRE